MADVVVSGDIRILDDEGGVKPEGLASEVDGDGLGVLTPLQRRRGEEGEGEDPPADVVEVDLGNCLLEGLNWSSG